MEEKKQLTNQSNKNTSQSSTANSWWQPAMIIFAQVTGWIAAPIIIALFLGKYLDQKYHTEPWIFLGLTGLSFIISCIGIVRITIKYTKKIESELKEKQNTNNSRMTHEKDANDSRMAHK